LNVANAADADCWEEVYPRKAITTWLTTKAAA